MRNPTGLPQVFWLKGSSETGKSTIAVRVAKLAHERHMLGSILFFSQFDAIVRDPRLLLPTIASHLAQYYPACKKAISAAAADDADIALRHPEYQFDTLIRRALEALQHSERPMIFIFDALDVFSTCTARPDEDALHLCISSLVQASSNIRIFATGRPNPYTSRLMRSLSPRTLTVHDLDGLPPNAGSIRKYLHRELVRITQRLEINECTSDGSWFSDEDLEALVHRSGVHMPYAETAIRFIGDLAVGHPRRQLDMILSDALAATGRNSSLDSLHLLVLRCAYPEGTSDATLELLRSILAYSGIITKLESNRLVAHFSSCAEADVAHYLRNLISILSSSRGFFMPHHYSFRELLTSRTRCRDSRFFIDRNEYQIRFALRCLETVKQCCLEHSTILVVDGHRARDPNGNPIIQAACSDNNESCKYASKWWTWQALHTDPEDPRWVTQGALSTFLETDGFISWLAKRLLVGRVDELACLLIARLIWWNCQLKSIVHEALRRDAIIWKAFTALDTFYLCADILGINEDGTEHAHIEEVCLESKPSDVCARTMPTRFYALRLCTLHQIREKRTRFGAACAFGIDLHGQVE
ncbi:hypothetical protein HGRIS_000962 [Hohenbuehelia grisea]|uniref:Nephrocystin 3-like N-terminal domain-containing protein n=1 Tax=Hohenbuehelia grisea TaxID=104357 RepID=A0ABR3IQC0_9AGAR